MERAELVALLRATGCAGELGGFIFLCDPKWGPGERDALTVAASHVAKHTSQVPLGWLCIPTGGTSGGVRFARHDESTLSAAVAGFRAHFGFDQVNAVDVLPPFHVSGLMARVRCAATGGQHLAWDWKLLEAGELPKLSPTPDGWVISLVPTQLQRLLTSARTLAWLREFRAIFIGGGPIWPALAAAAAQAKLPLSPSYGMTETAAMVAALRPAEFLAGERSCGAALPHARIAVNAEGVVTIAGDAVFRGYFPDMNGAREFVTEDLGRIDERRRLHILGRRDAVIITGGKKVNPFEVEAVLRESGEFSDVAVIGCPDAEWGEVVVACYPLTDAAAPDVARAMEKLVAHQRPKRFVAIPDWPRNAQGKVNRLALQQAVRGRADRSSP
ncbi:MAG TPA: AMP-binding protein [Opitutaceae bacterium]|nr:AMP-binding protein [Opitutaceae bacterium]